MTKAKHNRPPAPKKRGSSATRGKRTTARGATGWQRALERNLRGEGYSAREASELVEIAAH